MRGSGILAAGAVVLALAASGPVAAETVAVGNPPLQTEFILSPKTLPKRTLAAAAFSFETRLPTTTASGTPAPAVREIVLRLDRNIVLDFKGFPGCRADLERNDIDSIRALCRSAIVGEGSADFESSGLRQRPVSLEPTLVLNGGRRGSIRTLFVVSQVNYPQFTMAVFPVRVRSVEGGRFGREATLSIPSGLTEAVGPLGSLKLKIDHKFIRDGRKVSVINAKCPDGKLLLSAEFEFADGTGFEDSPVKPCIGRDA
jgi:hypothetical protein